MQEKRKNKMNLLCNCSRVRIACFVCLVALLSGVCVRSESEEVYMNSGEGTRGRQLIYNGWETSTKDYPFGVTLVRENLKHVCSGSLISPGVVLTAAHCFSDYPRVYEYDNDFTNRKQEEVDFVNSYKIVLGR